MARPVVSAKGQRYIYVAYIPRPPFQPSLQTFGLRLLVVLVIGGIFCYWLARYLTHATSETPYDDKRARRRKSRRARGYKALEAADEVGQLGRDFNSMAERLESMVKAQQRLLGDISHELRSPLARLGVALGLARQRSGAEANGALDRIERESDNLNEMISQLLTLTRLESGTDSRKRTDVDLAALVKRSRGGCGLRSAQSESHGAGCFE